MAASAPTPAPVAASPSIHAATAPETSTRLPTLIALAIAAIGVGVWLLRRRRTSPLPTATIDVIAQRSLGGKARVVWLAAGQRELIVAVTPQQVRVLGQWKPEGRTATSPATSPRDAARELAAIPSLPSFPEPASGPIRTASATRSSPAISGLLRLRDRAPSAPLINQDVATDDPEADALWAREILAATGARR